MNLSEFTTSLKGILGVTELKTIPELTKDVYGLVGLPDIIKDVVADRSVSFDVPDTVPRLRPYVFAGCTELKKATTPEGALIIPEAAFLDCYNLTDFCSAVGESTAGVLKIPHGVTEIHKQAFAGTAFSEIQIPSSVKTIADKAFSGCFNLSKVTFIDDEYNLNPSTSGDPSEGGAYDIVFGDHIFENCPNLTCIVLPPGVNPKRTFLRPCIAYPGGFETTCHVRMLSSNTFGGSSIQSIYFRNRPEGLDTSDTVEEPWGAPRPCTVLYGIDFVKDPCTEEIPPCVYAYTVNKQNERYVCEEDGKPCEDCPGNLQIADYTISLSVYSRGSKPPEGATVLRTDYSCYSPSDSTLVTWSVFYDTYAVVGDGVRVVSRFLRDTVYPDDSTDSGETDYVPFTCHPTSALRHTVYAKPNTVCPVTVVFYTDSTDATADIIISDVVLTSDSKISSDSFCTCSEYCCNGEIGSSGKSVCVYKTNPAGPNVATLSVMSSVSFTGVLVGVSS